MKRTAVITTTIRVPVFLEDVCKNALRYQRHNVDFFIIGDKKTPLEVRDFCKTVSDKYRFKITYFNPEQQEKRLCDYSNLLKLMPYNSGSRKMIGNFIACLEKYDFLIMLDDDNFVTDEDFFGGHSIVGNQLEMDLYSSPSGWYNVYESVVEKSNLKFYPRGYPWTQRFVSENNTKKQKLTLKVAVNNGLVLEDPDIDAISRLFWPIRVTQMHQEYEPHFGLKPGTWSSFNNQNTALSENLMPVYFTPPATGRNADIWTAYVVCRLAEHMQEVVAYGYPLVKQFRNVHNLWIDLEDELINDKATDKFTELLRQVPLTQKDYLSSLKELLTGCLAILNKAHDIPNDEYEMMYNFFKEYKIWQELFEKVKSKVIC